jgi:hypothetical protein
MLNWTNIFIKFLSQGSDGILFFFLCDIGESKSEMIFNIGLDFSEGSSKNNEKDTYASFDFYLVFIDFG